MENSEKLEQLRVVAGAGKSTAALEAALRRANGDLNRAADILLDDNGARNVLSSYERKNTRGRSEERNGTKPSGEQPKQASADDTLRRLAWRRFYKKNYAVACKTLGGTEKSAINEYIATLWKDMGSDGRRTFMADMLRVKTNATGATAPAGSASLNGASDGPSAAKSEANQGSARENTSRDTYRPLRANAAARDNSLSAPSSANKHSSDNRQPLSGHQNAKFATQGAKMLHARDEKDDVETVHVSLNAKPPKRPRPQLSDVEDVQVVSLPQKPIAVKVSWPIEIASRMCTGCMLVTGKDLLKANDTVVFRSARPTANFGHFRRRGGSSGTTQKPSRIARFYCNDRELGRLNADIGQYLAPALQSGLIVASARVISVPQVVRMFSEVILDLSISVCEEAFKGFGRQRRAAYGASSSDSNKKTSKDAEREDGVDIGRLAVVEMIMSLGLCEPKQQAEGNVAPDTSQVDVAQAELRTAADAEVYYDTVKTIKRSDVAHYVPAKHLAVELREYQKAGISWMIAREQYGSAGEDQSFLSTDAMLNPLWKRRAFPDGRSFFVNSTTGGMSLAPPGTGDGGPFGGILADEMGLGKTVQCIACVAHDMENGASDAVKGRAQNGDVALGEDDSLKLGSQLPMGSKQTSSAVAEEPRNTDLSHSVPTPGKPNIHRSDGEKSPTKTVGHGEPSQGTPGGKSRKLVKATAHDILNLRSDEESERSDDDAFQSCTAPKLKEDENHGGGGGSTQRANGKKVVLGRRDNLKGGTLVVCPMSLLEQWLNEFDVHTRRGSVRALAHYGQGRGDAVSISTRNADVIVTSYGILASECPFDTDACDVAKDKNAGPLFKLKWRRIILDEAHMIKGRTTKWARAAYMLEAERRWCVTGTPIQNHVNDLFSLLHFLRVEPWSAWAFWNQGVVNKLESIDENAQREVMKLIRDIISPITLRRRKATKDSNGKPIVELTKKTVDIVRLTPSAEEQDFYDALHQRSKVQFDTYLAQGKVMSNYASVLELLLRLRQACCHPYLIFAAPSKDSVIMKDTDKLFRQFLDAGSSSEFVDQIFSDSKSGDLGKKRECPICLDALDDGVAPKECGHPACRSCLLEVLNRTQRCPVCRVVIAKDSIVTLPRSTRFSVDLESRWRSSAKLDALLKDVGAIQERRLANGGTAVGKVVVFSQFTSMLDLVGIALKREEYRTLRIDGSVSQVSRAKILEQFETEGELQPGASNILLVSLRAGGVGLNLVAAAHAFLLDIHWNPQVDAQACDRVHRHGQTRDVVIKRYIVSNTVEERLLQVQARKQDIADGALSAPTDEDTREARIAELKTLFKRN